MSLLELQPTDKLIKSLLCCVMTLSCANSNYSLWDIYIVQHNYFKFLWDTAGAFKLSVHKSHCDVLSPGAGRTDWLFVPIDIKTY